MRYITRLATLCLATAAAAAAHHGAIVLIPSSDHESQTPKTIQENVAKLILEQRLHSGQYSHLGTVDEAVAELLNEYGGAQEPLFGDAAERDPRRLLVVLDGVDADDTPTEHVNYLRVRNVSPDFASQPFIESLLGLDCSSRAGSKPCSYVVDGDKTAGIKNAKNCLAKFPAFQILEDFFDAPSLEKSPLARIDGWIGSDEFAGVLRLGFRSSDVASTSTSEFVTSLLTSTGVQDRTVVLLPSKSRSTQAQLQRRSSIGKTESSPLAEPVSPLLPVCYDSETSCATATNNCSGHGECYLKSSSHNDAVMGDCYACRCFKTNVTTQNGDIRTIQWGGAACQKEDVSSPFFLLAGVTILAVVGISTAIKLLFNVGQQELPSVIAAGVSADKGPR
ncbi:hypothetical protein VTN31DRAFT_7362 [Thermomyces dupontii]|uniref:uncharacterized protein n=1 Tax=Talaromyces thermophilus TaxID=28565 RepID=UPI003742BB8A